MRITETPFFGEDEYFEEFRTLADQAAVHLREAVLSGRLAPNTSLSLKILAANLHMSPTPIREALRRLATERLVELDKFKGARVSPLAPEDLRDTYWVRILLEREAVRKAAINVSEASIASLTSILRDYQTAHEQDRMDIARRKHREFHFGIYVMAQSPWLLRLLELLWQNSERYQRIASSLRGSAQDRMQEHWMILESLHSGDPELAAEMIARHLQRTVELVEDSIVKEGGINASK